jgi:hypothetical protein
MYAFLEQGKEQICNVTSTASKQSRKQSIWQAVTHMGAAMGKRRLPGPRDVRCVQYRISFGSYSACSYTQYIMWKHCVNRAPRSRSHSIFDVCTVRACIICARGRGWWSVRRTRHKHVEKTWTMIIMRSVPFAGHSLKP